MHPLLSRPTYLDYGFALTGRLKKLFANRVTFCNFLTSTGVKVSRGVKMKSLWEK